MEILLALLIFAFLITILSAFFIARKVYRVSKKQGNSEAAIWLGIVSFLASFFLIGWIIIEVVDRNVYFGR
ncbi:MAG: hypothetical protein ACJ77K_05400 [Bacteroidia bacterium]